MAPEMYEEKYTEAVDVYAFGTLYMLLVWNLKCLSSAAPAEFPKAHDDNSEC